MEWNGLDWIGFRDVVIVVRREGWGRMVWRDVYRLSYVDGGGEEKKRKEKKGEFLFWW